MKGCKVFLSASVFVGLVFGVQVAFSEAVTLTSKSKQTTPTVGKSSKSKYQEGLSLLKVKDVDRARIIFEDYISEAPSAQRLYDVGYAFAQYQVWNKAIQYFDQVTKQLPKSWLAWVELGLAKWELNKKDDAIEALQTAILYAEKAPRSYLVFANILERMGNRYEARTVYQDMLKKGVEPAFAYSRLCFLYSIESFYSDAIASCKRAIERDSSDMNSMVTLGKTLVDRGERSAGLFQLAKAVQKFPKEAMPRRVRGLIYLADGNHTLARKDLGVALGLDPFDSESALGLGNALFEANLYEQAIIAYTEAVHIDKRNLGEFSRRQRMLFIKHEDSAYQKFKERISEL